MSRTKIYPESPKTNRAILDKKPTLQQTNVEKQKDDKQKTEKKLQFGKNYLVMEPDELIKAGKLEITMFLTEFFLFLQFIRGWRLKLVKLLRSKLFDVSMIILIILYTILIFLFFAIVDNFLSSDDVTIFYIIELIILGIFCLEIALHITGYGMLYLKDNWNVFDIFIIMLNIFVNNAALQGFLKIRSVFRLLRIFLLIRKLNSLRVKRDLQKRQHLSMGYDLRSPLERVLEIMNNLRDQIDIEEVKILQDLSYCIKIISSNQLYEAKLDYDDSTGDSNSKTEVQMLLNTYSKGLQNEKVNGKNIKHRNDQMSVAIHNSNLGMTDSSIEDQKYQISTLQVENMLKLDSQVRAELTQVDSIDFDIFFLREKTLDNELVTITSFLLAKEDLFSNLKINLDTFLNFIEKIQKGYKDVTYHNKTHGADLAQTFYYYSTSCGLREKVKMSNLDLMCLLVAGGCHDHEHPGFNNVYLVETKDNLALRYNGKFQSLRFYIFNLQMCLCLKIIMLLLLLWSCKKQAATFLRIFVKMISKEPELYHIHTLSIQFISVIFIGSILGTDMSKHFAELGKFKARLASPDFDPTGNDKDLVMFELFHFADISNSAKPWELCLKWTELLFIEFFHQGDLERNRGVPISYLMDRTVVNIAKSQIGFLDVIIIPSFTAASQVVNLEQNLQNLELNKTTWQSRFEEYEDRMNQEKQNLIQNKNNNTKLPSVKIAFQ